MEPKNVTELKPDEFKTFLNSFDYVFSDCDGVIWSSTPYLGSGKFFELMKKAGKKVHYVSNNSFRDKENYEAKFSAAGISNGFETLTVPSTAIAEYLRSVNFQKKVYCVTCQETMHIMRSYDLKCVYGPDEIASYYGDFIQYLEDDEEIGAVVFDSDFKVNLPKLYKACTYLKRHEVIFINGASDRNVPFKPGQSELGTGVFSDLVAAKVKREPIQLGKPGKLFAVFAMKRAGVKDPSRVLFIGDMIEQDIRLGKAAGFKTLLVLTTNSTEDMLAHDIRPDYYAPDLGSMVPLLSLI